jgi:hypothetical protein
MATDKLVPLCDVEVVVVSKYRPVYIIILVLRIISAT